jgi:hypothetical protein
MRGVQPARVERKAGVADTVRAVAASFFGVRGRRAHERDAAQLNPFAVIATGIVLAVLFVLALVFVVRIVVR